jgi:D-proline reductase (dithiol) PrdB
MQVDSYRFLPRSFRPRYEALEPAVPPPPWADFTPRLADARIALLSSAGLSVAGEQEPFDLDTERARPTWGDPSYRVLPGRPAGGSLQVSHLHINTADLVADHNVALPTDVLADLVSEGRVGASAPHHVSVMGYQEQGLRAWREETGPAIATVLRDDRADGVVLAPV